MHEKLQIFTLLAGMTWLTAFSANNECHKPGAINFCAADMLRDMRVTGVEFLSHLHLLKEQDHV